MGFDFGDLIDYIPSSMIPGIGFIIGKGPWAPIIGGGDNNNQQPADDMPDPFQAIQDLFSSPIAKIALVGGVGFGIYYMMKD